ncbi:MAG TPA: protein kinase [Polyangiaceae bacterium LLY-WYZ-15_(1-7)]|nr:protein kinase [Polyangiaceae bacterium LLY-WYZ-15_(1-7)]HJL08663.1 protein kinase [Polyangiaceae bacterium LLY-WYZ-15_(1-7)]HJL36973.1 protein kinase [Polyangiaceae bacterium LLY-WYZ-15_(1-7)]
MPALKAQSLGQYRLVRKLGTGGMAEVFLAAQRMDGEVTRPVVIKAILPHLAEDERFVEMFMREARVAAMLTHPNIVHIHDVTKLEGRPCIVMEFLKGRDLWTVLQRLGAQHEAVPPHAAAAIVAQAASALDYAHRKRDRAGQPIDLVHRDISPHNLFLTRDGHVRVLDFGIAKSAYQQNRTESGVIKGKLPYMAPEQARGKEVDGRADQFSLGIVLWEMLTGARLYAREDPILTMNAMFHEPTPKPSSVRPCPPALERIVMRALRRSPTDRFDSCESLAHALRTWMASQEAASETRLVRRLLGRAVPVGEDAAFYAPDRPQDGDVPSEELRLVGVDLTPSESGISPRPRVAELEGAAPPAPLELTPTPTLEQSAKAPLGLTRRQLGLFAAGGVAILGLAFGLTAWALSPDEPSAPEPTSAAPVVVEPSGPPAPVEIVFTQVPDGVTLEVDGAVLEVPRMEVEPSDEVHHVRALLGERELWRYDGIFRQPLEVELPPLDLPTEREPLPEVSEALPEITETDEPEVAEVDTVEEDEATVMRRRRPRRSTTMRASTMRRSTMRDSSMRRLGMQIDLSYP